MIETNSYDFLRQIFEESMKKLNKKYPFFIKCDTLRQAIDINISKVMNDRLLESIHEVVENEVAKTFESIKQDGYTLEASLKPHIYPSIFNDKVNIRMSDEQWKKILSIACKFGFMQEQWHDMLILKMLAPETGKAYEFLDFSNKYQDLLNKIISTYGAISFYGGELFTREQEKGNEFIHKTFSISSYQLDYAVRDDVSFDINQLKYYAESIERQIERKVYGDAIATIEVAVIS